MSRQLSIAELDPILATLEERFEESRARPLQVVCSKLLVVATFAYVGSYLFYLAGGLALIENEDLFWQVALALFGSQVVCAALGWRYLPVVARQRQFYRDLDLIAPDATPGGVFKERSRRQHRAIRTSAAVAVGALVAAVLWNAERFEPKELPPLLGILGLVGAAGYYAWQRRKISLELAERMLAWIKFGIAVWFAVLLFLIWQDISWEDWAGTLLVVLWPAWLLAKGRQVARIQERFAPLARAGGLRESLLTQRREAEESGSNSVVLPTEDVTQLAYVEREMIRQDRVDAISRTRTEEISRCPVFLSDEVNGQLAELEPEVRLAVHNAVASLSALGMVEGPVIESESIALGETGWHLWFELQENPRRVTVLRLTRSEPLGDG